MKDYTALMLSQNGKNMCAIKENTHVKNHTHT